MWNGRIPDRFPDLIVQAAGRGRRRARDRPGTRARHEGLSLLRRPQLGGIAPARRRDAARRLAADAVSIDAAASTAAVGPGVRGSDLLAGLREHELFFPVGHCQGVALGGYLLQGGFGWLSRIFGPACMSVEAIDVVTADGELVRADEERNPTFCGRRAAPGPASSAS